MQYNPCAQDWSDRGLHASSRGQMPFGELGSLEGVPPQLSCGTARILLNCKAVKNLDFKKVFERRKLQLAQVLVPREVQVPREYTV